MNDELLLQIDRQRERFMMTLSEHGINVSEKELLFFNHGLACGISAAGMSLLETDRDITSHLYDENEKKG